jgi:very-short-patch-repair endonuclease
MKNKIISYNPKLKELARKLRQQGILSEVLLWKQIKNKSLGVEFHRQVPLDEYIVDFFCHEIMLVIEIDGNSHLFEEVAVNDIKRQNKLEKLGIHFIRFNDKDVMYQMEMVLIALENKIEQLKEPPPTPLQRGNLAAPPKKT